MTLLELRTLFAKQSGRYDLVVPSTFADNGFNYYANQAQRLLDRLSDNPWTKGHYRTTLPVNESVVNVPGFRAIQKAWLFSGGKKIELRKRDISFLRQQFDSADTQPAVSSPLYFAEVPRRTTSDQQKYSSGIIDGTFDAGTADDYWSWASPLVLSQGKMKKDSTGVGVLTSVSNALFNSGLVYLLEARVYRYSESGTVTFTLGSAANVIYSQTGTIKQEVTADGTSMTITFSSDWKGWIDDVVVRDVHNEYTVDFESGSQLTFPTAEVYTPAITVAVYPTPDSDETWTFACDGLVHSPTLSADSDTSYWTDEHPQTLIDAVRYLLERVRRNSTGKAEKLQDIRMDLKTIEDDMTAGEVAKFTHIEQWREN